MEKRRMGEQALVGWRGKVAEGVAGPVSERSSLTEDQVRAAVGALFFALSVYYVISTVRRVIAEM